MYTTREYIFNQNWIEQAITNRLSRHETVSCMYNVDFWGATYEGRAIWERRDNSVRLGRCLRLMIL